jgi:hypothetical protein
MQQQHKKILGLRASAILEGILIIGILALIDLLVFDGNKFYDINPHPYWIAVLLLAVQYGASEGIYAAALATVVYLLMGTPQALEGVDRFDHLYHVFINPILWFFGGWLLGEMRARHVRQRNQLIHDLDEAQEREQLISDSYEFVKSRKEHLEIQIAGQLSSTIEAYRAAKTAESLDPKSVMSGIENLISTVMSPQKFSLHLLNDNMLDATILHGWQPGEPLQKTLDSYSSLYQSVVGQQQILVVANSEHERILDGQGILAGPIINGATGEVIGMLKIEQMDFTTLGLQTIESFKAILDWVGAALVNARQYQTAKSEAIVNPDRGGILTYGYFQRQSDYMAKLAKRIGFDLSMLVIKVNNPEALDDAAQIRVARQISEAVSKTLRGVDLAFEYQTDGNEFSILLPATPVSGANIVRDKIAKATEKELRDIRNVSFNYIVQAIHEAA